MELACFSLRKFEPGASSLRSVEDWKMAEKKKKQGGGGAERLG
jgi:hypothetical protein